MHKKFRYIKLGKAGDREAKCINNGTCFIGFMSGDDKYFSRCLTAAENKNDQLWESIREELISSSQSPESRQSKQAATSAVNQVRFFFRIRCRHDMDNIPRWQIILGTTRHQQATHTGRRWLVQRDYERMVLHGQPRRIGNRIAIRLTHQTHDVQRNIM